MKILLADTEGNDFFPQVTKVWTLQIAEETGPVTVYADQPGYPKLSEGLARLKAADKVVFHNAFGYDYWTINKVFPGTLRRDQIIDTLIISRLIDSTAKRHALAEYGEHLGFPKGTHEDFTQFSKEMAVYGAQDVVILQKMWNGERMKRVHSMREFYFNFTEACQLEFDFAHLIATQEHHGIRYDMEGAKELEGKLRAELHALEKELQVVFPPIVEERWSEKTGKRLKDKIHVFNPGSRDQIADRLKMKYGWEPIELTPSKKAKIDETILKDLPYPEAALFAKYLSYKKMLGQLSEGDNAHMKVAVKQDDGEWYIYGRMNTLGARTHRCSHFAPNLGQVDTDPRMRARFGPDKGHVQVGIDADGLELRELAHFMAKYDGGRYAKTVHEGKKEDKTDIHSVNQRAADLFLRDSAKTMIYAHNYGCFDKKLGVIWLTDRRAALDLALAGKLDVDPKEIEAQIKAMKSLSSVGSVLRTKLVKGVPGLEELIEKCKRSHQKNRALPGHDARWIPSASDHSALNTLLQGNGSIVMKKSAVLFDYELRRINIRDDVHFILNVHDEYQVSCPPELSEEVLRIGIDSIRLAGEALNLRCPLVGSGSIGANWSETH